MPAYYSDLVQAFLHKKGEQIRDVLSSGYSADKYAELKTSQIDAWREEIQTLRSTFENPTIAQICSEWPLFLEFPIPRRRSRIDVVVLVGAAIAVLEFKKSDYGTSSARAQAEDYALELAYFHEPSRDRHIYPIVVGETSRVAEPASEHQVRPARFCSRTDLATVLGDIATLEGHIPFTSREKWDKGGYFPVPTVVEAAIGMFQQMDVRDIAHADADPKNLGKTIFALRSVITESVRLGEKSICFVTGVPGAGKTLAGLSMVHDAEVRAQTAGQLSFISGNLPLVQVLQRALYEDQTARNSKGRFTVKDSETLIQTVYAYKNTEWIRDETEAPAERVIIFDEAQRAWNKKANLKKLKGQDKKKCDFSEPELILHILSRHQGWATLVCLVGGGQEIHTGEAGLGEWGNALNDRFREWRVYASSEALQGAGMRSLFGPLGRNSELNVCENSDLHLDNPLRQFRGKTVAQWVESVISMEAGEAKTIASENPQYPIVITRSLAVAKQWLVDESKGTQRYGLLASSEAKRLRAYGITIPGARDGDVVHWFLKPRGDVRSSFQLEVAATEFQAQGLEIDWAGLCWGGDFQISGNGKSWELKNFVGNDWVHVSDEISRNYLVNTYRVLLTRARIGLVIYVPEGREDDPSTTKAGYDRTAEYLVECGCRPI